MPMSQLGGLGDAAQQDRGRFQVPVRAHEFGMAEGGGEGEHVAAGAGAGRQVLEGPDGKGMSQRVRGRSAFFAGLSQAFLFRKLAEHVVRVFATGRATGCDHEQMPVRRPFPEPCGQVEIQSLPARGVQHDQSCLVETLKAPFLQEC